MMGVTHLVLIGTLVAIGGQPPAPRNAPEQPAVKGNSDVSSGKDPYANVFKSLQESRLRQELLKAQSLMPGTAKKPRVVCGMVVVPVTPSVDPKMIAASKRDPKADYKIRIIEPRICNE